MQVAFFGCGDSMSYGDYFCDAMGELYDQFSTTGATVIGAYCTPLTIFASMPQISLEPVSFVS